MAPHIYGFVKPGFEAVRDVFARNFDDGLETGASFSVVQRGEKIVDIWAGEQAPGIPWRQDTIVNVFSTTKGATALCCAICADRGLLDYNEKVSRYWPEFAQEGKGDITVAELLSHQAGLSGIRHPDTGPDGAAFTMEDLYDWHKTCAQLAQQKPFWEPGTVNGYHASTYGFLAGELVRRVTGQFTGVFFREHVSDKLGVDLHIGLPATEDHRVAPMIAPASSNLTEGADAAGKMARAETSPAKRELLNAAHAAFTNPSMRPGTQNTAVWRRAELPAANGHTNAAALARMYCCLALGGELDGVRLLSSGGVQAATRANSFRKDLILGFKVRWGMGFMLGDPLLGIQGPNIGTFGHSGAGGSLGFADPVHGIGFGYAMAKMSDRLNGDPRSLRLIEALYCCLGQPIHFRVGDDGLPMQTTRLISDNNGNRHSGGKPVSAKL